MISIVLMSSYRRIRAVQQQRRCGVGIFIHRVAGKKIIEQVGHQQKSLRRLQQRGVRTPQSQQLIQRIQLHELQPRLGKDFQELQFEGGVARLIGVGRFCCDSQAPYLFADERLLGQ